MNNALYQKSYTQAQHIQTAENQKTTFGKDNA